MDIFFYEAFEEEEAALRSFLPETMRAGFTADTIQEAGHNEPPAGIVSLRTQSVIPASWAGRMDAVLSRSTGYDHLTNYRKTTGSSAALGYLPLYCARAVAEHAMLLWMTLLRKLPRQIEQFNRFNRDGITGSECEGKNLLAVGVGNIGSEIVRIGQGLGMNVHGVDPEQKHSFVDYIAYDSGKTEADVIVCSMNLTEANRGFFNEQRFSGVKSSALFINIARGEHAAPDLLLKLLRAGKLGGAGFDVYDAEKELAVALRMCTPVRNPTAKAMLELIKLPNVVCTPHNAFNTHEAVRRKSEQSIRQAESFLQTGRFIWNVPD